MASENPRILITAGPTFEPIDEVRFIGNRSSGRMGIALAENAISRGWPTTLLLGPGCEPPPEAARIIRFQTAAELKALLDEHWPDHDILVMAAAVSDYAPSETISGKKSRESGPLTLVLEPTSDLLAAVAATSRDDQTMIGFALEEAGNLQTNGESKRIRKGVHAIVANPLETMDSKMVDAILLMDNGRQAAPDRPLSKTEFAGWLLDQLPMIQSTNRII